jgi:hypothetical protein
MHQQGWLLGRDEPACEAAFRSLERVELGGGAWLEIARQWLRGHSRVFDLPRSAEPRIAIMFRPRWKE